MDENKDKQITIYCFLTNHQIYLLHCICDLAPYIFKNIQGTTPQIEGTVRHAMSISAYGNENIRTQSHFLVRTTFSPYKKSWSLVLQTNEIPLYFKSFGMLTLRTFKYFSMTS